MSPSSPILPDLETLWSSIDRFYAAFSPSDWSRKHGKEWTFADMPYHLAYFNQAIADGIGSDRGERAKNTLAELNAWNDAHFANRPPSQAGPAAMDYLHATQTAIRHAAVQNSPDTPVFLPLAIVGGWRTLVFALEYLFNHAWVHFAESHLRYTDRLPDLPPDLVNRALNFTMQTAGGALMPEDVAGVKLVVTLHLTGDGGGAWTFDIRDGKCEVISEPIAKPDAVVSSDIPTYLKTSLFGMQNPYLAVLLGKTRIKGLLKARQFQTLFALTPTRIWQLVEYGRVPSPS